MSLRLSTPIQRLQEEITSSEFVEYMEMLTQEINDFHREDFFLAQIAAEVRRSYVKSPKSVKIKSFLHKFQTDVRSKVGSTMEASKAAWKALTGIK